MITLKPFILLLCLLFGCCTSKNPNNYENSLKQNISKKPNVIKQNVSLVEARIDSVILYDGYNFKLLMTILSVKAEEHLDSFAEPNQQVFAAPEYFMEGENFINWQKERNSKLLNLKNLQSSDIISVKISLVEKGDWKIIEVMK